MSRGKAGVRDLAIGGGLSIAHWNVNGIKSQVYGLKSEDESFREVIKNSDIIFLTETHASKDLNIFIPNFYVYSQSRLKCKKTSGGIAVLIRKEFRNRVVIMQSKSEDILRI